MKTKLSLIIGGLLLFSQAAMAQETAPQTYTVTASIPAAAGVGITVSSVNSSTNVFTAVTGNALTYNPLSYSAANKVWLATNYWAIDIANLGSGSPDTTVTYVAGSVPSGAISSLGSNSSISFDKEVYVSATSSTPTPLTVGGGTDIVLSTLPASTNIPSASTAGGWLRIYMGLCTGNTNALNGTVDPTGCKPFTNADAVGPYTGSLEISATTT